MADEPVIIYQNLKDPMNLPKASKWYSDPRNNQEYRRPMRPGEKANLREEPEGYSRGGSVKHGSPTCVVCKNKFS